MHTERRSPRVLKWRITGRRPVIVDVIPLHCHPTGSLASQNPMEQSDRNNPFSAPSSGGALKPKTGSTADAIKIAISIFLMICLLPFIPFGMVPKAAFLFGTSYAIYNYSTKLKSEKDVRECPNCRRIVGVNTRICPRCEQQLINEPAV